MSIEIRYFCRPEMRETRTASVRNKIALRDRKQ